MKLYDRDYSKLTDEEEAELRAISASPGMSDSPWLPGARHSFRRYSKGVRHEHSLFPNNYLDIVELDDRPRLESLVNAFQKLIDSPQVSEREVTRFIRDRCAYFIIASLLKSHLKFGHHEACIFLEFPLGTDFRADYLLAGRGSGGWELAFVELEAPRGNITLTHGDLGEVFRKGIRQVQAWKRWIEACFATLSDELGKYLHKNRTLPEEFRRLDSSRLHFVVIAGRRADFRADTYRTRREGRQARLLLHYDNLIDSARSVIGSDTY